MTEEAERSRSAAEQAAKRLVSCPVVAIRPASSGANSLVFRVDCDERTFALKRYPIRAHDSRDRRQIEWRALTFLRSHGLTEVPEPLGLDHDDRFMLMEWIDGKPIIDHTQADLDTVISFTQSIFRLSDRPEARELVAASEPCVRTKAILDQIDHRLSGLVQHPLIDRFLEDQVKPAYHRAKSDLAVSRLQGELPQASQRLIPADFGFHNALREPDGRLRFLDFDYFGWDDPAKFAADFVLHPAMRLSDDAKRQVMSDLGAALPADDDFFARLYDHLPLYAVRWALILLNAFRLDRLQDTGSSLLRVGAVVSAQIDKANRVLATGWDLQSALMGVPQCSFGAKNGAGH